jgi:hypothetical protein
MQENTVAIVARVRRRDDRPPLRKMVSTWQIWRDKEFLFLISKIWTGSRHLVFWSLETLTSLRDGVWRLVA